MQVLKLAKKAAKRKQIKRGVKEVVKAIRKNNKGWVWVCIQGCFVLPWAPWIGLESDQSFIPLKFILHIYCYNITTGSVSLLEISHPLTWWHHFQCSVKTTTFLTFMFPPRMNWAKLDWPKGQLPVCLSSQNLSRGSFLQMKKVRSTGLALTTFFPKWRQLK